ncbi:MAG: hypothetical protein VYE15_01605 [Myxococcota bacterium]|nr:hypothetical protein [Myxococcota bacterium]
MLRALMNRLLTTPVLCALACLSLGFGCGDTSETVDLTIVHGIYIDFDHMTAAPEQAVVQMDDLRDEDDYIQHIERLRCGHLATATSSFEVTRLGPEVLETTLFFLLEITSRDGEDWRPLAEFTGLVMDGEVVAFDDPDVTLSDEGLEFLSAVSVSADPAYDLRITGEVPDGISELEVDLELELAMSSIAGNCR